MNNTRVGLGGDDAPEQFLSQVSTFESLIIQAMVNQLTDIVVGQNRTKRISYENQLTQVQTLRELAQTALMLTDSETVFLHGEKLQYFLNQVALEHALGAKSHERNPKRTEHQPTIRDEEPGD